MSAQKHFNSLLSSFAVIAALATTACSPSVSQLKKVMEENPEILTNAFEKNSVAVMESLNKAAMDARTKQAENSAKDEEKAFEEEFKSPKKPTIADDRAFLGKKDAPITIVEYSDFECPYCGRGHSTIKEVVAKYGDKVVVLFKHLPLDFHPKALPAAKYFEAIALQSAEKAYKFHDEVFENQDKLREKGEEFLKSAAKKVGADMKKVAADLDGAKVKERIEADKKEAASFGFQGTPAFLINGVSIKGAYPLPKFEQIIDRWLKEKGIN